MFKLSPGMIKEIEEKVNATLDEVHDGMKERLSHLNDPFVQSCWLTVDVNTDKVTVIDPIQLDEDDDELEFGDVEYNDPF